MVQLLGERGLRRRRAISSNTAHRFQSVNPRSLEHTSGPAQASVWRPATLEAREVKTWSARAQPTVIPLEVQVHVLVEEFLARDLAGP